MNWELWSGVAMVTLAIAGHALAARGRRSFVRWAEGIGGPAIPAVQAVVDVVVGLVYVAFVALLVPVHGNPAAAGQALDALASFALVMAAMESVSMMVVHRVAQAFEPWPPAAEVAA